MNETQICCTNCKKLFLVDISGRTYVFCPYCGYKEELTSDEFDDLRSFFQRSRDPMELWETVEKLYRIVKVEKRHLKQYRNQPDFAKGIGMKPSLLSQYLTAFKFVQERNLDKSRLSISNAYELSRANDYFDEICAILSDLYGKDVYSASAKEIRAAIIEKKYRDILSLKKYF